MPDLTKMRPKTLAELLEKRRGACAKAVDAVFALASSPHERFLSTCERLGDQHAAVAAYSRTDAAVREVEWEAQRRYGARAVSHPHQWVTFLRGVKV